MNRMSLGALALLTLFSMIVAGCAPSLETPSRQPTVAAAIPTTTPAPTFTPFPTSTPLPISTPFPTLMPVFATATAVAENAIEVREVVSGTIGWSENGIWISTEQFVSEISLVDSVASAKFYAPDLTPGEGWSYGIVCRYKSDSAHVVFVNSSKTWQHILLLDGTNRTVEEGDYDVPITSGANQSNDLRVIAMGDHGQLWVNGCFVANLDMSGLTEAGNVWVTIGADSVELLKTYGKDVYFTDFVVWSLDQ